MITIRLLLQPGRIAQPVDDRGRPRCKTDTAVPMKHIRTVIAALLTPICATAAPIVTNAWVSNVRETARPYFSIQRGETVALDCTLLAGGTNAVEFPPGTVATFYWQTNGMDGAWWSTNATAGPGGHLRAVWTPAMDPWASLVSAYIGATSPGGEVTYRAAANIRIVHAPGAEPNAIDPPVRTVDFAAVAYTNAPWLLPADLPVPATGDPAMDGSASPGTSAAYARADHVHPTDTSRVAKSGDTMTGGLTVPNLTVGSRATGTVGANSVAVGGRNEVIGANAYAQGYGHRASGENSHAEGSRNIASGANSHAEGGEYNMATGESSHAEGDNTAASGVCSHAEGSFTQSSGNGSHSEGCQTVANGIGSHAEGYMTATLNNYEHAQGRNNFPHKASDTFGDSGNTLSSIGFADDEMGYERRNAVETMQDGKTYFYGLGGYNGTNPTASGVKDVASAVESKQDAIADLDAIRSGAAAGATAVQPSALSAVATSGSYEDLADKPTIPTVPAVSTDISADAASDAKTASPKAVKTFVEGKGYLTSYTETDPTVPAWAKAQSAPAETDPTVPAWAKAATPPVSAPSWSTASLGANPATNLAASAGTAYRWTGSGTLTVSSVSGLSPEPTYIILDGFSALSLPAGFDVAGAGSFRPGREVHLALWSTPTTNLVNFLFAR